MGRVVGKGLLLFLILNIVFALWYPMSSMGRVSAYNRLFRGRQRLPYADNPQKAYNLSLFNLEAMFASHELAGASKQEDEYRVLVIGDSSTWGFLLSADDTLAAELNELDAVLPDGRVVRAYNLGYPVMSLTKDLLLLSYIMQYEPDLIVWSFTLESFPRDKQLFPALLQHNPQPVLELINNYQLDIDVNDVEWERPGFWDRTIVGARRALADLLRLQLYGVLWAATGIDQDIPETYTPRMEDLPEDDGFHNLEPPVLDAEDLALDVLAAGVEMAGDVPVLLINEPMFISQGENSDIRYNFYYPRWAYDDYRQILGELSEQNNWNYLDLWDIVSNTEFTNSAVHLSQRGSAQFAQRVLDAVIEAADR